MLSFTTQVMLMSLPAFMNICCVPVISALGTDGVKWIGKDTKELVVRGTKADAVIS